MIRLAIVTTHPIQYNAPLFRMLASHGGLNVRVFYTLGSSYTSVKDRGFGKEILWDIPLLDGYAYEFLENISKTPSTSLYNGVINPDIISTIKAFHPTIILIYGWSFVSHLKVMRYFKNKIPVYFRGDSTLLNEKLGIKVLLRRLFLKWVYKHIDKAFYVGTNNKQYFLKHGVKEDKLVFAPHAIDNARFGNVDLFEDEAKALRTSAGIPEKNILFAYIGKFENVKSPLILIEAFKKLQSKTVSLLFVGNGHLEEELKRRAATNKNIYFLPFQNQSIMPAIYRIADVFVLPSVSETWGLSVNEAMACGLPVIVSDKVGCALDLVQNKKNGYIFSSGNSDDLLKKLSFCSAKTKIELKKMGQISFEIIKEWNYNRTSNALVESTSNKV
jgi:glycosyltransferase involved in cell wall biosynthesis